MTTAELASILSDFPPIIPETHAVYLAAKSGDIRATHMAVKHALDNPRMESTCVGKWMRSWQRAQREEARVAA